MIYVAWIIFLIFLTLGFNRWYEKQHNPNQSPQGNINADNAAEVTLLRNRQGHYVANGKINGKTVTFILDTGATVISIPASLAKRLNLPAGTPHSVATANGNTTAYSTRLNQVSLGPIQLDDVRASITPGFKGNNILLGMNFLKHLELIQRGNKLILRQYF